MALDAEFQVKLEGVDESSPAYQRAMKAAELALKAVEKYNQTIGKSSEQISKQTKALSTSSEAYKKATTNIVVMTGAMENNNSAMSSSADQASGVAKSFNLVIDTVADLIDIFRFLTDPQMIQKVANVLDLLRLIAQLKGQKELANGFRQAREGVLQFGETMSKVFGEGALNFTELRNKLGLIADVLGAVKTAAIGFVSVGLATGALMMAERMGLLGDRLTVTFGKIAVGKKTFLGLADAVNTRAVPGFLQFTEKALLAGTVMTTLGSILRQTENDMARLSGKALIVAGVLIGGFGAAAAFAAKAVGGLAISLGVVLFKQMAAFEKMAIKGEAALRAFQFTVRRFGKELGTSAVGSLERWNSVITQLASKTKIGVGEIRKAVQFLISEAPALGLIPKQIESIVRGSADVAASTASDFNDVVKAVTKGLGGQTQAAFNLGIAMNETAIAHSKLGKTILATNGELDAQEKVMARLEIAQTRFALVNGAAADELNTVAGATAFYEKRLARLQIIIGRTGVVTSFLIRAKTKLLNIFLSLPDPIIRAVGALMDVSSVVLIVSGTMLVFGITLGGLITAFKVFQFLLNESAATQIVIGTALNATSGALGIQTVEVTSAGTAWAGFNAVIRATAVNLLTSLVTSLRVATLSILKFTAAMLLNPLFIKAVIIVGGLILAAKAMAGFTGEVQAATAAIRKNGKAVEDSKESVSAFAVILQETKNIGNGVAQSFTSVTKVVGGTLSKAALVAANAANRLALSYVTAEENIAAINKTIAENDELLRALKVTGDKNLTELGLSFEKVGTAMDMVKKKTSQSTAAIDKMALKARALAKIFSSIDEESIKIAAIGDEFERGVRQIEDLKIALNKAEDAFGPLNEKTKEQAEAVRSIKTELVGAQAALLAVVKNNQNAISDSLKEIKKEQLEQANDQIKLITNSANEQIAALERVKRGLQSVGRFFKKEAQEFQEAVKGIRDIADKKVLAEQNKILELTQAPLLAQLKSMQAETLKLEGANSKLGKSKLQLILAEKSLNEAQAKTLQKALIKAGVDKAIVKNSVARFLEAVKQTAKADIDALNIPITFGDVHSSITSFFSGLGDRIDLAAARFKDSISDLSFDDVKRNLKEGFSKAIDFLKVSLSNITVSGFAKGISKIVKGTGKTLIAAAKMLGPASIKRITKAFDFIKDLPRMMIKVLRKLNVVLIEFLRELPKALVFFLQQLPQIMEKIFRKLPKVFEKLVEMAPAFIQAIVDQLPTLIDKIGEGLTTLFQNADEILDPIIRALPKIVESIIQALPSIITAITESVPLIVRAILQELPAVVEKLADNIAPVVDALVTGLVGGVGEIGVALIDELILRGGIERIVGTLLRSMPRIAAALVAGIVKGLARFFASIQGLFSGFKLPKSLTEFPDKVQEAVETLGTTISREASNLFKVLDLQAAARGEDAAARIGKAINQAVTRLINGFNNILAKWRMFWDWVMNTIFIPILEAFRTVFNFINEQIFQPFIAAVTTVFMFVKEQIFDPIIAAFAEMFLALNEQIFVPIIGAISAVFSTLKEIVFDPIVAALTGVFTTLDERIFKPIRDGFKTAFDGLKSILQPLIDAIAKLANIKLPGVGGGGGGLVSGTGTPLDKFRQGGVLDMAGNATRALKAEGGRVIDFSSQGVDTVPILAQPGESFVNKASTRANLGLIEAMNANPGKAMGMGGGLVIERLEIIATGFSKDTIRREIMPTLTSELKKLSKQGVRILDPAGVRT